MMYWNKAPIRGGSPTHGLRAHTSRSRIMWRGFSVAATTGGVSRTCGVSILVRGSSLVFHWAKSTHDFFLFRYHRDDAVVSIRDAGRATAAVPRALCDSGRTQDRHHRRRRGRVLLQQRLCLRYPDVPLVAPDVHDQTVLCRAVRTLRCSTRTISRYSGSGNRLQALNDVWTLDRIRWEQVTISGHKQLSPRGNHMANAANLVQNVIIVSSDGCEYFQDHRLHHSLMVSSLKENHTSCEGLLIASKGFLRIFTDAANHVPCHCPTQSVFALSRFTLHFDSSHMVRFLHAFPH